MSYFPKSCSHSKNKRKVELDLPNYAPKSDIKQATDINTLKFAKETDLGNIKSDADELRINYLKIVSRILNSLKGKVDKSNVDKLRTVPVDMKKLSDVVDEDVVKSQNIIK